jgi:hypothetical protein
MILQPIYIHLKIVLYKEEMFQKLLKCFKNIIQIIDLLYYLKFFLCSELIQFFFYTKKF